MLQINKISETAFRNLEKKGIKKEDIIISFKADFSLDMVRCDNYIFATESELIIMSGVNSVIGKKRRAVIKFTEISYNCFDLEGYESFKVEAYLSTARLIAKNKNTNNFEVISNLSNSFKNDAGLFVKYLKQFIEKKEIKPDEKDFKRELFCPKCENRYPNPERKVCPHCMDKGKLIKRMSTFFIKYKLNMFFIMLVLIATSAVGIITPYISAGFFYDNVLTEGKEFYGQIGLVLFLIVATKLFSTFADMVHGVVSSRMAAKISYDIRKTIFQAIERLSLGYFTNRQTGALMTQIGNDTNSIYWFFCDGLPYVAMDIVRVIAVLVIMLVMDVYLTLISVITIPLFVFLITSFSKKISKLAIKRYAYSRGMNGLLNDVLSGVRVVKAFSKEKEEIKRFDAKSADLASADRNLSVFVGTRAPISSFVLHLSTFLVLGFGGWMVATGNMTYGYLMTFSAYIGIISAPIGRFVNFIQQGTECLNASQRLFEVMDAEPEIFEKENAVSINNVQGKVEFKEVSFSYEKSKKIIDNVSFEIEPGKMIGIVGHTGAGKSTIANLLIRLYDVNEGEIKIDDVNVKDLSLNTLRRSVAIVSQETFLFMGTILDNIRYANPEASYEEVIAAAQSAGAHDFIIRLQDGYQTKIGAGHRDLSGGERQRISIARALLHNPKILILDEATASMDTETERKIQNALERLVVGRTTVMIAHRISTLRNVDKLIVIENGKMTEFGTHLELINKKGIYYKLYKLQAEALKNVGVGGD